ncbi:tRNA3(Ser)-specific nuclease WapA [Methanosarcinales archaeon]|nr:tRNA3(Ser)-specific nuclease WapA [Methanosarcinales archaeon]
MLFEHWIYSLAIAIIAGMIHLKRTGRDYSWIIIASALAPDMDIFAGYILKQFDVGVLINGIPLQHGDFHNIAVLLIYAVIVGLVLKIPGMKFKDSFTFAGIGFGAHIFEDVLVYNPGYAFLWPLSTHLFGLGLVKYNPDFFGIANTTVLIVGLILILVCVNIRVLYEGNGALKRIARLIAIAGVFSAIIIPGIGLYNGEFKEEVRAGNIVDNWQFTQNTSWDSTVFHNGNHSARIEIQGNESKISGVWSSSKITVKPDTNYTFSSWGRTERVGGNYSPAVRVVELDAKGKWIRQTTISFGKGTNNWTQKQVIFKTRSNASLAYVYGNIWKGYGTFWFDDLELKEKGTGHNMVPNSGFEIGIEHIINLRI